MQNASDYEHARRRAVAKYQFYSHVAVYVAVMALLVVINLLTSPGTIWFIWPLIGWGLAVALHAARVFLLADRNTIVDALTEQELQRGNDAGQGN